MNVFVFGLDAQRAVEAPRIHHQWVPDRLLVEEDMVRDVVEGLARRGHKLEVSQSKTAVQLIVVDAEGTRSVASDPRKGGRPAVQSSRLP